MTAQLTEECQLMIEAGRWRTIRLVDTKALPNPVLRCPACHGPGVVMGSYTTHERYRFAHKRFHDGCELSQGFSGSAALHPDALA